VIRSSNALVTGSRDHHSHILELRFYGDRASEIIIDHDPYVLDIMMCDLCM
jgi:hypothetical protein